MSYDMMFKEALKLHQQGFLDEAASLYLKILQTTPNNPKILNLLGIVSQTKGNDKQACNYFEQAIINGDNTWDVYFNLAWALKSLGKYSQAIDAFNKVLKLKPDTKEAYNALGEIYATLQDVENAKKMFQTALDYAPGYEDALINTAYLDRNEEALQKLSLQFPDSAEIFYYLALIKKQDGDFKKALEYALKALEKNESYSLLAGELCLKNNLAGDAKKYFTKALAINPDETVALINLANCETDETKAEEMYKKAIEINSNDFDAHLNYGVLLQKQNRLAQALEEYRLAVIINPYSAELSSDLGMLERRLGDLEQALKLFFNAFNLEPQNSQYAHNIAETLSLYYKQNPQSAQKIADDWQKRCSDNVFAKHIASALKQENIGLNSDYSRALFDLFSDNNDETMQKISYRVPQIIAEKLKNYSGLIIDLGCGTGLLGEKLHCPDVCLYGVDISQKMLDKAAAKNIYERLIKSDIEEFCSSGLPDDALLCAADVIGYIGDIASLTKSIFPRRFIFSAAVKENESAVYQGYSESGRLPKG